MNKSGFTGTVSILRVGENWVQFPAAGEQEYRNEATLM